MPVHHHGLEREVPLAIDLIDDAGQYPQEPDPEAPALVFAGRHDDAVPLAAVERFARARAGRELVVLDAGHELVEVLEPMWDRTVGFLRRLGAI
jgi:pimeloyl-ACP methyl ester carboxylesterase